MSYVQLGPPVLTAVVLALAVSSCTSSDESMGEMAPAAEPPSAERPEIVVEGNFARVGADVESGSGHTVRDGCGRGVATWPNATASLEISQIGRTSHVRIAVHDAKPDTLFTVWLKLKGDVTDQNGEKISFGGNPLTEKGATALARGDELLDVVIPNTPPNPGTREPSNGFITDANGDAVFEKDLDFPVIGGAYPFTLAGAPPSPIANPADPGVSEDFLLRLASHCQDDLAHGLLAGDREPWFDWPE